MAGMRLFFVSLLFVGSTLAGARGFADADLRRGEVFLLRHALAPGSGDPPEMRLEDPSSQRNLSEKGRAQARTIGRRLRAEGVTEAVVFTSVWNRCRETAQLLDFGEPTLHTGLNSFWQRPQDREVVLADFQRLVDSLPDDGPPVILVTHYVNIQAVTGQAAGSGEGIWVPLDRLREPGDQ